MRFVAKYPYGCLMPWYNTGLLERDFKRFLRETKEIAEPLTL